MDKAIQNNTELLKEIAKKYELHVFIAFGSRVTNEFNEDSDYDFAYFSMKPLSYEIKRQIRMELETIYPQWSIDLIELNTHDDIVLRYEILENGYCLFEIKEGLFWDLQGKAWIDYVDFLPWLQEQSAMVREEIRGL